MDKRSREELEAAREELAQRYPIELLDNGAKKVLFSVFEDPLDVWALYKYGGVTEHKRGAHPKLQPGQRRRPSLYEWANAHDVWSYILEKRFALPAALIRSFPNSRWLYFAYAFAKYPMRREHMHFATDGGQEDVPLARITLSYDEELPNVIEMDCRSKRNTFVQTQLGWRWQIIGMQLINALAALELSLVPEMTFSPVSERTTVDGSVRDNHTWTIYFAQPTIMRKCLELGFAGMMYAAFEAGYILIVNRHGHTEGIHQPICASCMAPQVTRVCGACEGVGYCSERCATRHWKKGGHQVQCLSTTTTSPASTAATQFH